jgi:hypothetical protein
VTAPEKILMLGLAISLFDTLEIPVIFLRVSHQPPKTSSTIFVGAQLDYKTSNSYQTVEKRISPIG